MTRSAAELVGFTSRAITLAWGTSSDSSSSRLAVSPSSPIWLTPREVAARPGEAGDQPVRDRIAAMPEDDGDRRGRAFRGECRRRAAGQDQIDLATDEIGGQCGQPIVMALRPEVLDRNILYLDVDGFAQSLVELGH